MRKLLIFTCLISIFIACKKEKDDPGPGTETGESTLNYNPMTIGSYWVYQHYQVDTLGAAQPRDIIDSVSVVGDTAIGEHTYRVLRGGNWPFSTDPNGIVDIIRDSLSYLVNQHGRILFSRDNFDDEFSHYASISHGDTLFTSFFKMVQPNAPITVPAGSFECLNYQGTFTLISLPVHHSKNPRQQNFYHAPDVGKVQQDYFYASSPEHFEKRLIRFYIAPE